MDMATNVFLDATLATYNSHNTHSLFFPHNALSVGLNLQIVYRNIHLLFIIELILSSTIAISVRNEVGPTLGRPHLLDVDRFRYSIMTAMLLRMRQMHSINWTYSHVLTWISRGFLDLHQKMGDQDKPERGRGREEKTGRWWWQASQAPSESQTLAWHKEFGTHVSAGRMSPSGITRKSANPVHRCYHCFICHQQH